MRVKEPSSWSGPEKVKRSRRTNRPPDEDSSDDIVGMVMIIHILSNTLLFAASISSLYYCYTV